MLDILEKCDINFGKLTKKELAKQKMVKLEKVVGKTVKAIGLSEVEGAYGYEPCVLFFFTDNTYHGVVMPAD